ncbi:MAG: alpha-glucan family phosphorylase [Polyangia bacterium]|jgi:starch phosphorylase
MTSAEKVGRQLFELAMNMWWAWNPAVIKLFRDIDPSGFHDSKHNPLMVVKRLSGARLEQLASDAAMRARLDRAYREFRAYISPAAATWAETHAAPLRVRPVAYFSAEFGIHESLPIYSGGLGVLAGDHLKTASDLGLALVAVGLFYRESYFRQHIDHDGQQHAKYVSAPVDYLPIAIKTGADGKPLIIDVPLGHERLLAQIWQVNVGRNQLLLLDTDVEGNSEENRRLSARLYFGDQRVRIRQELLLGVGGIRALRACGIVWSGLHLNEGHSAFATLEYARLRMVETGGSFIDVAQDVAQSTVFTTHTPVDAGHDRFPPALANDHLEPLRHSLKLTRQEFLGLGRVRPSDDNEALCMTVLAFKMSRYANAVSCLHGRVTRRAWQVLWPHHREDEVPVGHITNGVHARTWLALAMQELYIRHIGPSWADNLTDPQMWARIDGVSDAELWETHRTLRAALVSFVRREVAAQRQANGLGEDLVLAAENALDPDALTIGFARRFATYKRPAMLFSDMGRLTRIVCDASRPVQIVVSGKAHPADRPGQEVLKTVIRASLSPALRSRVVFVEDYDINVARHLVQGVDVWLNTPRRPQEASGTSGEKVLLNGGLNLSVLDGWWAEAYDGQNGFAIGSGVSHLDFAEQDRRDADSLYRVLENEVVPLYYQQDEHGVPHGWVAYVKRAIRTLGWRFNTDRMLRDYVFECYLPSAGVNSCSVRR